MKKRRAIIGFQTTEQCFEFFLLELSLRDDPMSREWFAEYQRSGSENPWTWYNKVMPGMMLGVFFGKELAEEVPCIDV